MNNRIFEYYRDELRYLYEEGARFAEVHTDIASLLDFKKTKEEDPFVRRLVEAFAFLTARIQLKIDSDFPQIAEALLSQVLPLATQPFPALAVVQFEPGDQMKPGGELLLRNETRLQLENYSETYFRTGYDLHCLALKINSCNLTRDFEANNRPIAIRSASVLEIQVEGMEGLNLETALGESQDSLRFYCSDETSQYETAELILNSKNLLGIGIQLDHSNYWEFPATDLRILGFQDDELVLPVPSGLPKEYQILMELFAYPVKHLFFEIPLPSQLGQIEANSFQIFFYLKTSNERLESLIGQNSFKLNCCPAVNLHQLQTVATKISPYCVDTVVEPNLVDSDFEIFELGDVTAIDEDGRKFDVLPFYGVEHTFDTDNCPHYMIRREPKKNHEGTDVLFSLVDLAFQPATDNKMTEILTQPLCCNRKFGELSQVSQRSSDFKVISSGIVDSATRVSEWQRMLIVDDDPKQLWQLVTLLNLNFLLLKAGSQTETLRRLLKLLDRSSTQFTTTWTTAWIDSIVDVSCRRKTDRIQRQPWAAVADGTCVNVKLDESRSSQKPGSWFLFAAGLNYFFSLHTGINSFTELKLTASEDNSTLAEFEKRCGTRKLI